MKSRRTKALEISPEVKAAVRRRDGGFCVLCGAVGSPTAHYISRAQGGLGIEENIVTLCWNCHLRYDQSPERESIRLILADYLKKHYPEWDEGNLIYKKYF